MQLSTSIRMRVERKEYLKSDGEEIEENVDEETEENDEENVIYKDEESSLHIILLNFVRDMLMMNWLGICH